LVDSFLLNLPLLEGESPLFLYFPAGAVAFNWDLFVFKTKLMISGGGTASSPLELLSSQASIWIPGWLELPFKSTYSAVLLVKESLFLVICLFLKVGLEILDFGVVTPVFEGLGEVVFLS
jgi:hypothetical protein